MQQLPEIEVYICRTARGDLSARVATWPSDAAEDPRYGPELLPKGVHRVETAQRWVTDKMKRKGVQLIWLVDNTTVLARTLNDRAVSTGRDNYGFRSAGR